MTLLLPLWTAPAIPCLTGDWTGGERVTEHHIQWNEDSSGCALDNLEDCSGDSLCQAYYPGRPQVEAIGVLPDGAPALPDGIFINYLSLDQLNATPAGSDLPSGHVINPPFAGFGGQGGPWTNWMSKRGCIEGGGRFAGVYGVQIIY